MRNPPLFALHFTFPSILSPDSGRRSVRNTEPFFGSWLRIVGGFFFKTYIICVEPGHLS